MTLVQRVRRKALRLAQSYGLADWDPPIQSFTVPPEDSARMKANPPTEAHRAFFSVTQRPAYKWAHYLEIYDRYMKDLRGKPIVMFEIGVFDGGSLEMWRNYLGSDATIVGIDINPACADRVDAPNIVRIGSQADRAFLDEVIAEFGRPDVVLDDGSHIANHQRVTFDVLFPQVREGGLYMVEDTHTSYWRDWEGGYRRAGTAIEEAKKLIDDQHAWYHSRGSATDAHKLVDGIHFHDSIVVIEKATRTRPGIMSSHEV